MTGEVAPMIDCPCCEQPVRPDLHSAEECRDNLKQRRNALGKALEKFISAAESEDELISNSADIFDAYEDARTLLGDPIKSYPGGYYDEHFHLFGWKQGDHCDTCEDYKAEQAIVDEKGEGAVP